MLTPVYNIADPLQGSGDPWASTTPWLSFSPFFLSEPVAFRRVYGLESYSRTSGESNHHRQSVSDVKNATIPTEPRGRLLALAFHQALLLLFCQAAGLPGSQSSADTGTWQTGNSGQSGTSAATFGMPPGFLDSGFTGHPHCHSRDPVMAQMLRQQMLLTQGVMDLLFWTGPGLPQQPVQQTPTVAQNSTGPSERLTMDTKWIPATPLPDWKSWNNRARELAGFKGWLEKFASWLCLVHDSAAQELKEAMNLPYPVVIVNRLTCTSLRGINTFSTWETCQTR